MSRYQLVTSTKHSQPSTFNTIKPSCATDSRSVSGVRTGCAPRIETGEPGVAIGSYAIVLFGLGMTDRLAELADPRIDAVALQLEEERLPQRIRRPRK
jgi:hypothetical protein